MNKKELVKALSEKLLISRKEANESIDALVEVISETLAKEEKVKLVGFGTFEVVKKKARKGINPQTKKKIKIPAKTVPKFVPGKVLKEQIEK